MTAPRLSRPLLLVGCGKMGEAMLRGWLASGIAAAGIVVIDPSGATAIAALPGVSVHKDASTLPQDLKPEVMVLAVKPQMMAEACAPLRRLAGADTLILSIAAGKTLGWFADIFGATAPVVRSMPNTPAAIGRGITVAVPNAATSAEQSAIAKALLEAVGEALLAEDEGLIDAVTAVSGSGPAYVFLLIECMTEAGVQAGLPRAMASRLAMVTVAGAGALALESGEDPAVLRRNVTSPNGTTQEALSVLMAEDGLQPLMTRAIASAARRSRELAG